MPSLLERLYFTMQRHGVQLIVAVVLAALGWWLIRKLMQAIGRLMDRQGVERDVQPFLLATLRIALRVALLLSVLSTLGVNTGSFVAVIGAAGLAVGLALQNSLANFAGGLLILAFKPFRVGDLIDVQNMRGYVEAVHLFNTTLLTTDNRTLTVPNNTLTNAPITNFTRLGTFRIDLPFIVDRGHDVDQVRSAIRAALGTCTHLLPDHNHEILVGKLTADAMEFTVRVWTNAGHIEEVPFVVNEAVVRSLAKAGIGGPRQEVFVRHP